MVQCNTRFVGRVDFFFYWSIIYFTYSCFFCLSSPADAKPLLAYLFHLMLHLFSCSSPPPPPLSPKKRIVDANPSLFSNEPSYCRRVFGTITPYTVKLSVFKPSVDTPRRRSCFDLAAGSFRAMTTCLSTRSLRVGTASPSLRRRKNERLLSSTAAAS